MLYCERTVSITTKINQKSHSLCGREVVYTVKATAALDKEVIEQEWKSKNKRNAVKDEILPHVGKNSVGFHTRCSVRIAQQRNLFLRYYLNIICLSL